MKNKMKKILCLSFLCLIIAGITFSNVFAEPDMYSEPGMQQTSKSQSQSNNQSKNDYFSTYQKVSQAEAIYKALGRENEFYGKLHEHLSEAENFYNKLAKCSPARIKIYENGKYVLNEAVLGKTKQGLCSYVSYGIEHKGNTYNMTCQMPMNVAVGYATTAVDALEYFEKVNEKFTESIKQNDEIAHVMFDYCKIVKKS